jgi:hypothetical protein
MATEEEKEHLFQAIEVAVDAAVSSVIADHYDALTQEPQLSAKITLAIEHAMDGMDFGDLNVEVKARDFPSLGRGALEGAVGADVYISVAIIPEDRKDVSKGMIAQAKWDEATKDRRLPGQIEDMTDRTDSSYVWVYGPNGVTCYPAGDYLDAPGTAGQTVGSLIADGLRCTEGDRDIGRDLTKPTITSLREAMEELRVARGMAFTVREGSRRNRFYRKPSNRR